MSNLSSRHRWRLAIACAIAVTLLFHSKRLIADDSSEAAAPVGTTVFELTDEQGTRFGYRIPALVVAGDGTLCAFCERRVGLRDHAENDIVLRRSTDGGATWLPLQILADEGGDSLNDPCVVRLPSGRLLLRFTRFPKGVHANVSRHTVMAEPGYDGPKNVRISLIASDDHGQTWSKARDVTRAMRRETAVSLGSPGVGIVLSAATHRGRVVLPNYEVYHLGEGRRKTANSVSYSDDGGETWQLSATVPEAPSDSFGDEAQLAELPDGALLMSSRDEPGGTCRKLALSRDGGETWSTHRAATDLQTPPCMSSLIRLMRPDADAPAILLHTLPHTADRRENGTIMVSRDNGSSWTAGPVIVPGSFAYSCLAELPGGDVGCLFETDDYRRIALLRIAPEKLVVADSR